MKKIIPDDKKSIRDGALIPVGKYRNALIFWQIEALAKKYSFSLDTPVRDLSEEAMQALLFGSEEPLKLENTPLGSSSNYFLSFDGIVAFVQNQNGYSSSISVYRIGSFMAVFSFTILPDLPALTFLLFTQCHLNNDNCGQSEKNDSHRVFNKNSIASTGEHKCMSKGQFSFRTEYKTDDERGERYSKLSHAISHAARCQHNSNIKYICIYGKYTHHTNNSDHREEI